MESSPKNRRLKASAIRKEERIMTPTGPTFFVSLRYRDARKALQWLSDAFGLERGDVYPEEGSTVDHAEMFLGSGGVMFGSVGNPNDYGIEASDAHETHGIYAAVDDVDAHYARARAAGAEIVRDLRDTEYGSREYTARDFEGHLWSFGTYAPKRPT